MNERGVGFAGRTIAWATIGIIVLGAAPVFALKFGHPILPSEDYLLTARPAAMACAALAGAGMAYMALRRCRRRSYAARDRFRR